MAKGEKIIHIIPAWETLLCKEFEETYLRVLMEKVGELCRSSTVCPPPEAIFRALNMVLPSDVRVVILGQDPYHTKGVADGLAFSSFPQNPVPPSLLNIFKEIEAEFGYTCLRSPDLTRWAEEGVLLLNTSLTVTSGQANSHSTIGWHEFTDAVIRIVNRDCEHVVFLLWGNSALKKKALIDNSKHLILESPHPSPLSAHKGFLGNGHFKKTNEYLKKHGRGEITWC